MSGKVVGWAMEQTTGSPAAKLVLAKLADNANEQGLCWPSIKLIVEHTELGQATVYKHLATLEDLGLIESIDVTVRGEAKKGFQLTVPDAKEAIPPGGKQEQSKNSIPPGGKTSPPAGKTIPPAGTHIEEPSTEPSKEPSLSKPAGAGASGTIASLKESRPDRFPDFRDAVAQEWPRGFLAMDLAKAMIEFDRATRLVDAELLVECATRHGQWMRAENARRGARLGEMAQKTASNWLKEGCWKGYIAGIAQDQREAEQRARRAAEARAALGPDVIAGLKKARVSDTTIDAMAGAMFESGANPRLFVPTPFLRSKLQERSHELNDVWPGLRIELAERRATG